MAPLRSTPTLTTLALGATLLGSAIGIVREPRLALADDTLQAPVFTIPDQLPANATLILDGSPTMAAGNEVFRQRMAERYPSLTIQVDTSSTPEALEKLRQGSVDLAAIGRRLTEAELNEGLVEVPISREKIALIVGIDNPFSGGITPDQLAQMFYGEINNWSAVGGPDLPLRFVDRPAISDTRQALGTYPTFAERGLNPGPTVVPVGEDSTEAVIAALGRDGVGYAVVSQVEGRTDLRLLTLDGVLPTDARYPYSQPRVYVYNGRNPSPAALAFLGIINTPANLAVSPAAAAVDPTDSAGLADPAASVAADPASPSVSAVDVAPTDSTPTEVTPDPAATSQSLIAETSPMPTRPWGTQDQSWGWLIAIPLLGGLLWWLLRKQDHPKPDHQAVPSAAVTEESVGRLVLVPRHCRRAYAYWEIPAEPLARQRERGGRTLMLRLLDVTNRDVERHPPVRIEQFPVTEEQQDLHLPIAIDNRDYQAELGYVTQENHWLPLAKSAPVRVPACAPASAHPTSSVAQPTNDPTTAEQPTGLQTAGTSAETAASPLGQASILTLHPSRHQLPWDSTQQSALAQVSATYPLSPGTYRLRIQRGHFSYGDLTQPGEPVVLLWAEGGPITNLKTQGSTSSLWATLNGYADTLTLAVAKSAQLHAFFIDTNPETNQGQVVLAIQTLD